MRVIGVGDNTVDRYLHLGFMFPGGNSVNVPVFTHRLGHPSSYLGVIADDQHGNLVYSALSEEGIDLSHSRLVEGENAFCEITLNKGDRVFGDFSAGVCDQINLTDSDLNFINTHDLTHTSIYSHVEPFIKELSDASQTLSFDFSQDWDRDYLRQILPFINIALLSNPVETLEENQEIAEYAAGLGPQIVLVTSGEAGALLFDGSTFYEQEVAQIDHVVDTLGAGDAFAARFMVDYICGVDVETSLRNAASFAAETCAYFGAFGHGKPL